MSPEVTEFGIDRGLILGLVSCCRSRPPLGRLQVTPQLRDHPHLGVLGIAQSTELGAPGWKDLKGHESRPNGSLKLLTRIYSSWYDEIMIICLLVAEAL